MGRRGRRYCLGEHFFPVASRGIEPDFVGQALQHGAAQGGRRGEAEGGVAAASAGRVCLRRRAQGGLDDSNGEGELEGGEGGANGEGRKIASEDQFV